MMLGWLMHATSQEHVLYRVTTVLHNPMPATLKEETDTVSADSCWTTYGAETCCEHHSITAQCSGILYRLSLYDSTLAEA